jgi:NADP-dependent 3-hydroxy acid dehydrogenase YdfG
MPSQPVVLNGRVAAITGAARGIGKATAAAFVREGIKVAIGDLDHELAQQTAAELGHGTIALALDVTDRASFAAFLDTTEEQLGPVDIVVNNAGIMLVGPPVWEEDDGKAQRQIDINVNGVLYGIKEAIPRFRARGAGHLVNIASGAGKIGFAGGATYCGCKHFVVGASEALRAELHGSGIKVSCVNARDRQHRARKRLPSDPRDANRGAPGRCERDRQSAPPPAVRRVRPGGDGCPEPGLCADAATGIRGAAARDEGGRSPVRHRPGRTLWLRAARLLAAPPADPAVSAHADAGPTRLCRRAAGGDAGQLWAVPRGCVPRYRRPRSRSALASPLCRPSSIVTDRFRPAAGPGVGTPVDLRCAVCASPPIDGFAEFLQAPARGSTIRSAHSASRRTIQPLWTGNKFAEESVANAGLLQHPVAQKSV